MTNEQAKSELMQIYGMLSEEKKKAMDMAVQALDIWDKIFTSYDNLVVKIESENDISHATERIDEWCVEQLRSVISDYYADRIIKGYETDLHQTDMDEAREQVKVNGKKSFKMRDATPEEREAVDKYIKSISRPTGINIFDFYGDGEKNCLNCKHQDFICEVKGCKDYKKWEQADGEYISKDTLIEWLKEKDIIKMVGQEKEARKQLDELPSVDISFDHDGCKDCRYQDKGEDEFPCCECQQNFKDMWQKKPHWNHGVCDNCGYDWGKDAPIASVPNFCPNCGARMVNPQESEGV